ncbi:hypothetical protein RclHR1_09920009, partial [Rhizophagus clarus]
HTRDIVNSVHIL